MTIPQVVINALRAADPNREVNYGTSTDDGSSAGQAAQRTRVKYDYNCAALTGVTTLVSTHLDPQIGVGGASRPTSTPASATRATSCT